MTTLHALSSQVLLVIMDGFGENPQDLKNAVTHANKPHLDDCFEHYPFTTIIPGGEAVGLPKGVAGNSEVGHLNLGAGRPVRQDLVRINEAITNNSFKDMPRWKELIEKTKNGNKRLHLMGLLSDGGVHAHINHLKHILGLLQSNPEIKVYLHAFMDGRDTQKTHGINYVKDILPVGKFVFASMQGRSIGMDRDRRFEKIKHALDMMTGHGEQTILTPVEYIKSEYDKNIFDEFITPALFTKDGAIQSGDSVFFFNYRPDRAKQISLAMNDPKFSEFPIHLKLNEYLCMSPYVQDELPSLPILFDKEKIPGTLAEYLAKNSKKQFKIAETEKYAHVTYFFNGGEEKPFAGEERKLIPSPKEVATYDLKPQMSAFEVCEELSKKLADPTFSFFCVNFANSDMVGHTGNYEAAVMAIEAVDTCIGKLKQVCAENNIVMLITADHGNADQMIYPDGAAHTSHTEADVPFCVVHPKLRDQKLELNSKISVRALKDVAPTILYTLGMHRPESFTGDTLFL